MIKCQITTAILYQRLGIFVNKCSSLRREFIAALSLHEKFEVPHLQMFSTWTYHHLHTRREIVLPYIKEFSEVNTSISKSFEIYVAHKPTQSLHSTIYRLKDKTAGKKNKFCVIEKVNYTCCKKYYIAQGGRIFYPFIHENKLVVGCYGLSSLESVHPDNNKFKCDRENVYQHLT